MSTYFHDPWADNITPFRAAEMNEPLGDLDQIIYEISGEIQGFLTDISNLQGADTTMSGEISNLDSTLTSLSGEFQSHIEGGGEGSAPYDIGIFFSGEIPNGMELLRFPFPRAVDFDFGGGDSQAKAGVAATAQAVFSIKKGVTEVGTITFAGSGTVGTFSGEASFASGDVISLVAPATADATLASIGFALAGER